MNKRKPDDEFAKIDLSYVASDGKEVIVYCPESKNAQATQRPVRKALSVGPGAEPAPETEPDVPTQPENQESLPEAPEKAAEVPPETEQETEPKELWLREQHFTIMYGDTGYSYESIIGPYLEGAREVIVEDPYVRLAHQVQNFVRFCEAVIKQSSIKKIRLVTGYDSAIQLAELRDKIEDLRQSLLELDIALEVDFNQNMHDREIRIDNGWIIKIGRGLDFYQKPDSWFQIGAQDLSLRKCLETKVDIFRTEL